MSVLHAQDAPIDECSFVEQQCVVTRPYRITTAVQTLHLAHAHDGHDIKFVILIFDHVELGTAAVIDIIDGALVSLNWIEIGRFSLNGTESAGMTTMHGKYF